MEQPEVVLQCLLKVSRVNKDLTALLQVVYRLKRGVAHRLRVFVDYDSGFGQHVAVGRFLGRAKDYIDLGLLLPGA